MSLNTVLMLTVESVLSCKEEKLNKITSLFLSIKIWKIKNVDHR